MTPTLVISCTSLPPEGADSTWGGPAASCGPHALPLRGALPPEGADSTWGGPAANLRFALLYVQA